MADEPPSKKPYQEAEDPAVTRFREYLRINTTSVTEYEHPVGPQPDYDGAVKFLTQQANEIGLPVKVIEIVPRRPAVIVTLEGENPQLPSILLNSHTDVVPAVMEHWECDPFAAVKKENGDIVARGTQDMKCCGMWYLEAVRRIKAAGRKFARTVYLTFVPDEEVGSFYGMRLFVKMDIFKDMNVGFCLDEGLATPTDHFTVFYAERSSMCFSINCPGNPGHGSRFIENTAVEKVRKILNHLLDFRAEQEKRLKSDPSLSLGDVTTVNVTKLTGGVQYNVVPHEMGMWVDIRISPTDDAEAVYAKLKEWVRDGGEDCTINFYCKDPPLGGTVRADDTDPWWQVFTSSCEKHNVKYREEVLPCGTDARFVRELGIPVIGFSPINNTPTLLHDHNEFLNERVYLKGIPIYEDIIASLATVLTCIPES